jgi:hypothetical protein
MKFYCTQRPHSALAAGLTPNEAYAGAASFSTKGKKQKRKTQQQQKLAA